MGNNLGYGAKRKALVIVQKFILKAVLVPEFTISMPEKLTLSTGLDALSHAMEDLGQKPYTLSQALAITAIEYIKTYLPRY